LLGFNWGGVTAAGLYLTVSDELKREKSKLEGEKSNLEGEKSNLEGEKTKLEEEKSKLEEDKSKLETEKKILKPWPFFWKISAETWLKSSAAESFYDLTGNDGYISLENALSLLEEFQDFQVTEDYITNLFRESDLNNDGKLTYEEFFGLPKPTFSESVLLYLYGSNKIIDAQSLFNSIDSMINQDNYISRDEINNILLNWNLSVSQTNYILNLFDKFDSDKDERLSKEEFGIVQ
jgi:Ca2+-binding EF-hand superfamily protein